MKRLVLSAMFFAAAPVVAAPAPFAKPERPDRKPNLVRMLEERGRMLLGVIRPGTSQEQVIALLGWPDLDYWTKIGAAWLYRDLRISVYWNRDKTVGLVIHHPRH
jgi:hypothetical protein